MSRRGTWIAALLAAAALLFAGLLSSCGGSSSDSTTTRASGGAEAEASDEDGSGESRRSEPKDGEGGTTNGSVPVAPLQVSGGGSGQFRVKGGDNSIQEFGEESTESERDEAAVALHAFLVSLAEEDWKAACSRLSKAAAGQLRLLGENSQSGKRKKVCRVTLASLFPTMSRSLARESTIVDVGSLRVEGDRGFLIYRGARGVVYAINMTDEDGWKVGALAGVPLS